MWLETAEGQALVKEFASTVVVQFAPEEQDLFDLLIADYFQHPAPPDLTQAKRDDTLGFGLGEAIAVATPAAAAAISAALTYIAGESLKALQEEGASAIKRRIRAFFKNAGEVPKPEVPAQGELKAVYEVAAKEAQTFGMSHEQAARLATMIVGTLALSVGTTS